MMMIEKVFVEVIKDSSFKINIFELFANVNLLIQMELNNCKELFGINVKFFS